MFSFDEDSVHREKEVDVSITLHIHKTHRQHTNGLAAVKAQGRTVGACLNYLIQQFPPMKEALFDAKGKLRRNIEIFINAQSAYPDELKKQVLDGDEIYLTVMLAGG
jgi:molybdopterin converting factor small subunit